MPDKLTDSEIVKILETSIRIAVANENSVCMISKIYAKEILDLINRPQAEKERYLRKEKCLSETIKNYQEALEQAKAENERLEKIRQEQGKRIADLRGVKYEQIKVIHNLKQELITAKAEAYKEFVERLKEKAYTECDITGYKYQVVQIEEIDNLLKEFVGDINAEEKE